MSKNRFNPNGFPSPAELGFKKGQRVINTFKGVEYPGVVSRVNTNCITVIDDTYGTVITCHPYAGGGFLIAEPAEANP